MSALKKTEPVPALSVRLLRSVVVAPVESSSLLIGELLVKVMSPAPALPVSMRACVCSFVAPLKRMPSSLVVKVMRFAVVPPFKRMPVPPMTSVAAVPEPMSIAPSVMTSVTKLLPPAPVLVSVTPKVTPPAAVSIVNWPRR